MYAYATLDELDGLLEEIDQKSGTARDGMPSVSGARESPRQPTVMIVDDEPLMVEVIRQHLTDEGYRRIVTLTESAEAMAALEAEQPDVLLLDVHMPTVDGLEILARIRQVPSLQRISVIVLTAAHDSDVKLRAFQLGATDFLHKPLQAAELLVRLRNVLDAQAREERLRLYERRQRLVAERELVAAEQIQTLLFPKQPPVLDALDIAGATYSAGIGCGDYYDFLTFPDGRIGLVVGDVSGHGMPSALRMVETRAYLRSLARRCTDPSVILDEINRFMIDEAAYGCEHGDQFVTMSLAAVDRDARHLTYASAGHPGYLIRGSGEALKLDSTGLPLGVAKVPYECSQAIPLVGGDALLLATDGIEESMAPSGEQFGETRMLSVVQNHSKQSAERVLAELHSCVCTFTQKARQRDDVTAIVLKVRSRRN